VPVTVRLFAAAREAAGTPEVVVPAGSVAAVCDAVVAAAPADRRAQLAAVLEISALLVAGTRYRRSDATKLADGTIADVLPPFAGG
jgi:molybdopterin synthase sulfur carrier subunit